MHEFPVYYALIRARGGDAKPKKSRWSSGEAGGGGELDEKKRGLHSFDVRFRSELFRRCQRRAADAERVQRFRTRVASSPESGAREKTRGLTRGKRGKEAMVQERGEKEKEARPPDGEREGLHCSKVHSKPSASATTCIWSCPLAAFIIQTMREAVKEGQGGGISLASVGAHLL